MSLFRLKPLQTQILGHIATAPGSSGYPITNIYWDPDLQKMVGEYDDSGMSSGTLQSTAPPGKFPITNIYFDPSTGRMVGEYDDGG